MPLYTTKPISHNPARDWFPPTSGTISPWIFSLTHSTYFLSSLFQISDFFFSLTHRPKTTYTLFKRNKEMRKKLDLSFSSPQHSNQTHRPQIANKPVATHKNWRSIFSLSLSPPSMAIIHTTPNYTNRPPSHPKLQTTTTNTKKPKHTNTKS